jgi:hypothetical protein
MWYFVFCAWSEWNTLITGRFPLSSSSCTLLWYFGIDFYEICYRDNYNMSSQKFLFFYFLFFIFYYFFSFYFIYLLLFFCLCKTCYISHYSAWLWAGRQRNLGLVRCRSIAKSGQVVPLPKAVESKGQENGWQNEYFKYKIIFLCSTDFKLRAK